MYDKPIDRQHPGCIVFLLDQSTSMRDSFAGTRASKAVALAQGVNDLVRNLVLQCQRGEDIRDYYELAFIGYGSAAGPPSAAACADSSSCRSAPSPTTPCAWPPRRCRGAGISASIVRCGWIRSRAGPRT